MSNPQIHPVSSSEGGKLSRARKQASPDAVVVALPPPNPMQAFIPPYLRQVVFPYHGDFCSSLVFHPQLIVQLMAEGFLPIAAAQGYLLPKLHKERCVVRLPSALHVSKSTRKKASKFSLTINRDFVGVVEGCHNQHENCWLYPQLVQAFSTIQKTQMQAMLQQSTKTRKTKNKHCRVRLYSIELYNHDDSLVAGELGYSVGSVYTSLTGFSSAPSAGSVQLAALGQLLSENGFTVWDLGMDMEYKRQLGAHLMSRQEFLKTVQTSRQLKSPPILCQVQNVNARDLIDGKTAKTSVTPPSSSSSTTASSSVRQPSPAKKQKSTRSHGGRNGGVVVNKKKKKGKENVDTAEHVELSC